MSEVQLPRLRGYRPRDLYVSPKFSDGWYGYIKDPEVAQSVHNARSAAYLAAEKEARERSDFYAKIFLTPEAVWCSSCRANFWWRSFEIPQCPDCNNVCWSRMVIEWDKYNEGTQCGVTCTKCHRVYNMEHDQCNYCGEKRLNDE